MVNFGLRMIYKTSFFLLFSLFFLPVSGQFPEASAATVQAELDRNKVSLNESFTLVFTTDGSEDGDPDFTPLEQHFEIHGRNEGSKMSFINGEITKIKQWTLTLMAKQPGFFTIPSITFGADQSRSLRIDIEKVATSHTKQGSEPIFIEVSTDLETVYVQAQVIYTLRLYHEVNLLSGGQLSEPVLSDSDAVIEKLGKDRQFETMLENRPYRVIERRYAIFPQRSGQFTIEAISFAGQLATRSMSKFSPFTGGGAIKRLRSREIQLEVLPVPKNEISGRWLPARGLHLEESWPDKEDDADLPVAGEPLTWTITLMADGLTSAQLPEIAPKLPKTIKAYPDQATLKNERRGGGIIGIRQQKIDLIPGKPGTYRLPAVEIPWWNTITEKMEVARLPAREVEVIAEEGVERGAQFPLPSHPEAAEADSLHNADGPLSGGLSRSAGFWSWISLILGVGWIVTLIAWWGSRQKPGSYLYSASADVPPDLSQSKRALRKSCNENEASVVKEALLLWGHALWPGQPISLGEIKSRVGENLADEIEKLNRSLYSRQTENWENGSALWAAFEHEKSNTKKKTSRKRGGLSPMVPRT